MAANDEELNKNIGKIKELTIDQLVKGIRVWVEEGKEEPGFTIEKSNSPSTKKE